MVTQPHLTARPVSLAVLVAFLTIGIWLFVPWGRIHSSLSGSGGGDNNVAAAPSLKIDGPSQIESQGNVVTRLVVPISVSGSDGVRLPERDGTLRAETSLSESAAAAVPGTYGVNWLDGNGDDMLDPGEHAELIVDLPARSSIHPSNPLRLVVTTADGALLPIEHVID
jgi:hypothetical protein